MISPGKPEEQPIPFLAKAFAKESEDGMIAREIDSVLDIRYLLLKCMILGIEMPRYINPKEYKDNFFLLFRRLGELNTVNTCCKISSKNSKTIKKVIKDFEKLLKENAQKAENLFEEEMSGLFNERISEWEKLCSYVISKIQKSGSALSGMPARIDKSWYGCEIIRIHNQIFTIMKCADRYIDTSIYKKRLQEANNTYFALGLKEYNGFSNCRDSSQYPKSSHWWYYSIPEMIELFDYNALIFKNAYQPSPEELEEWANNAETYEPEQDWEYMLDSECYWDIHIKLATDPNCPKNWFSLHCLYNIAHSLVAGIRDKRLNCHESCQKQLADLIARMQGKESSKIQKMLLYIEEIRKHEYPILLHVGSYDFYVCDLIINDPPDFKKEPAASRQNASIFSQKQIKKWAYGISSMEPVQSQERDIATMQNADMLIKLEGDLDCP